MKPVPKGDLESSKMELKSILISASKKKQAVIDLCNLPAVDGYCHVVVLLNYLSK